MSGYNTYDYNPETPFIPLKCDCNVDMDEVLDAIEDATNEINCSIRHTNQHINCSANRVIQEVKDNAPCMCNVATKADIRSAVEAINGNTNAKFDEIDFIKKFDDLNNQIKGLNHGE